MWAGGERVRAPDEVLEMNRVLRGLHVLDEAGVKLGCVLLYLDTIARCQRGKRVPSHQHRQPFAANASWAS